MPQVPNRYFNSPWIADAAKNLSIAIAGDPERDAARLQQQQIEANMARQNEADILAREDRARSQSLSDVYSRLATASPEEKPAIAQEGFHLQANPSEIFSVWGKGSPPQILQEEMLNQKFSEALKQIGERGDIQGKISEAKNEAMLEANMARVMKDYYGIDVRADTADKDRVGREIVQRMRGPTGQTPIDITPAESNEMYRQVQRHAARLYDADLNQKDAAAITMLANKLYQKNRDADVAMKTAWKMYMGDAKVQEGERWGGFGTRGRSSLVPQTPMSIEEILGEIAAQQVPPAQAQPQAAPGGNLSNAFTPPTPQMQRPFYPTKPAQSAPTPAPPAAVQYLQQNPTPEQKAFFKDKYGYLPPGL